jgi:hypothetical protein
MEPPFTAPWPVASGGGNHRGSIFRLIVGTALMADDGHQFPTWGKGSTASAAIRTGETGLECEVSKVIGAMPFVWLAVDDDPGKDSLRGYIERNSIALLSNYRKPQSPDSLMPRRLERSMPASSARPSRRS